MEKAHNQISVTVFTPTYNRGYIIDSLYQSLRKQTCTDFEWLVIDDGSADNTEELFFRWTREDCAFPIRYLKVKNGGKHRAINRAVNLAAGKLFFIVDSDDYLCETAIENLIGWMGEIEGKSGFAGVSGNKGYSKDKIVGETFVGKCIDATFTARDEVGIKGDKAEAYYTDVLKRYPFPEFEGENFITERVVWDRIGADGLKIRWVNEIIYICEYLEDGLTRSGARIHAKNPKGTAYNLRQMSKIYRYSFVKKLRSYHSYYELTNKDLSIGEMCENLCISKFLMVFSVLVAWCYRLLKRGSISCE